MPSKVRQKNGQIRQGPKMLNFGTSKLGVAVGGGGPPGPLGSAPK